MGHQSPLNIVKNLKCSTKFKCSSIIVFQTIRQNSENILYSLILQFTV